MRALGYSSDATGNEVAKGQYIIIGTYRKLGIEWSLVDEVSGNINTYLYKRSDQIGSPPYIFRVLAVNAANTATLASEARVTRAIVPDETAPKIIQLEWIPQNESQFDADTSKYGSGLLTVQIELSEPIAGTPYFALIPPGVGLPYRINMIAVTNYTFEGVVAVESEMPSGDYQAFALLKDLAGNRSRSDDPDNLPFVDTLQTHLTIDTEIPKANNLNPSGQSVFKNEAPGNILSYTFTFDEELLEGSVPVAGAEWGDGTPFDSNSITLQNLGAGAYQVDVELSATDGYDGSNPDPNPDIEQILVDHSMLTVLLEVEDTVGNEGLSEIPSVLIYRNMLPQVAPPVLTATTLPGGEIRLEWEDVSDADRYRLLRVDPSGDEVLAVVERDSDEMTTYEFNYTAPSDGEHSFYVFGEREDPLSPGTYIAGYVLSSVSAVADSTAPQPAHTVEVSDSDLSNPNSVLRLDWQHPDSSDVDHFDVYRTDEDPVGTTNISPSWTLIHESLSSDARFVFDSQPVSGEAWYIVVATDTVGNEVLASNFDSIDITVVPPAEVKITLVEGNFPVLSWTAVDSVSDGGSYSVYYRDASDQLVLLESGITELSYMDISWDGGARTSFGTG